MEKYRKAGLIGMEIATLLFEPATEIHPFKSSL
jgi:hypothetical protein